MEKFTALRNGILEHRRAGKMPPFDSGIFDHLIMRANWETGIYHGCALALAFDFGDVSLKEPVQRCLRRLRDRRYINYRTGTGARGGYDILIHKYEVTKGKLSGMRLNAWASDGLPLPKYELQNCVNLVDTLSAQGKQTVGTPIQDVKTLQDVQDKESSNAIASAKVPPTSRGTRLPQDFAISEEHRKFANEIGVDVDHQSAIFRDYWTAQPGQRGLKSDWNATFRNWLRRAVEINNRNEHGGRNGKPSIGEIVEREQAIVRDRSAAQ